MLSGVLLVQHPSKETLESLMEFYFLCNGQLHAAIYMCIDTIWSHLVTIQVLGFDEDA